MNNNPGLIRLNSIDSFKIINPNGVDDYENIENIIENIENIENINENNITINSNPDYVYTFLLNEIYENISDNKELFSNSSINITKPEIKFANLKTCWLNYGLNCSQINRTLQQLHKFLQKEIKVDISINEKQQLILRGKFEYSSIVNHFKKYIKNYVQCSTCKSLNTEISRNTSNRLDYLKCLNPKCNTCKVVSKI